MEIVFIFNYYSLKKPIYGKCILHMQFLIGTVEFFSCGQGQRPNIGTVVRPVQWLLVRPNLEFGTANMENQSPK